MSLSFSLPALSLLALLSPLLVGCGSSDTNPRPDAAPASPDAAEPTADAPTGADLAANPDLSDGSPGTDSGGDGPAGLGPIIVPISPTGHDRFYGVTYDPQGNLYAVGQVASSTDSNADIATVVAKFTSAGALDKTFGGSGFVVRNVVNGTNGELFRGIVVQATGKVVVSGTVEHIGATDPRDRDIALFRLDTDGTRDTTFGTDGVVTLDLSAGVVNGTAFSADSAWGLARYPDDRLVVSGGQVRAGGVDTDFALVRLAADGARDATFGTAGVFTLDTMANGAGNNASPRNVTILPGTDGVIGAGYQPVPGADTAPVVYKVNDAGQLDTTFGTGGVFSQSLLAEQTECYQAVVQPVAGGGYKLITTGYGRQLATETTDLVSLRLTSNGVLDPSYGTDGLVRIDIGGFGDNSRRLVVLPDGRILLAGGGRLTSADVDGVAVLLTPDGQPDTTFSPKGWRTFDLGGPADFLWAVALSPDSKTAALVGIKGVGAAPMPASANDDAALLLLPLSP
jgi:uncharacterized delta-60 repeat protein